MRTFYIIQMIFGGYYWRLGNKIGYAKYTLDADAADRFDSKEEALEKAPSDEPFTLIEFYHK
jgi:hypothetical protein